MSPKCLSLPAMSPGNRDAGRYGNIPVPRSLMPSMSESPTRSSPKPGRNLSTPPTKKRTLRHRKLGYPETNSNNNHTQAATEEKSKVEDAKKPKKCSQTSFILPLIAVLAICAVAVIAVQLFEHGDVNEGKRCSISALEEELNQRLFGQHIAKRVVPQALSGHLAETHGSAPLVMSFLGPSGVGKTFVSRLVSTFLSESCGFRAHEFIIPHHFPHPEEAQLYREQVRHWVKGNISYSNQQHLFVFDEMEKVYPDLADGLLSLLEEDTSNSMYLFVYSTEDLSVSMYLLEQLSKGRSRESIREDEIQDLFGQFKHPDPYVTDSAPSGSGKTAAAAAATSTVEQQSPEGHAPVNHYATMATAPPSTEDVSPEATDSDRPRLVWQGDLGGKISNRYLVPFLPLEREHVLKCAEVKLATDGRTDSMETAQRIVDEMQFYPGDRPVFSKYGCKRLSVRVDMSKDN
ncbi:torsin-1A-like [Branchiostoma floridae x Branchiostoma belcheri]